MPTPPTRTPTRPESSLDDARGISVKRIVEAASEEATGSKTVSYLLTTASTGIVFVLLSLVVLLLAKPLQFPIWIILSFFFALIFSPVRYGMEEFIRQLFPELDYNSHQLVKRLNTISYSSLSLSKLASTFFAELEAGLDVIESGFIFYKNQDIDIKANPQFKSILSLGDENVKLLRQAVGRRTNVIHRFHQPHLQQLLNQYHIKLIAPLTNNDKLVGLMLLGSKSSQQSYTTKDLKVINAVIPKIGFSVINAITHEKVTRKNSLLIKELQDANQRLTKVNQQLKHDDKLKDEFIYVATHELKNPVTALKGYLSLIGEGAYGPVPNRLQTTLTSMNETNQQLIDLLNNLLDIARAEAESLSLKIQSVKICDTINLVIDQVEPLLRQKNLKLEHLCPNPNIKVLADPERLKEIINNLVSNAIKYSESGTITISHEIMHDKLVTHVNDQGVGIPQKEHAKIFTRFFRVQEEAARGIPGSGLGLFIVKQLLERMDGKITFTSTHGKGSVFSIHLPLAHTQYAKPS